jgi:hypothetical protein
MPKPSYTYIYRGNRFVAIAKLPYNLEKRLPSKASNGIFRQPSLPRD